MDPEWESKHFSYGRCAKKIRTIQLACVDWCVVLVFHWKQQMFTSVYSGFIFVCLHSCPVDNRSDTMSFLVFAVLDRSLVASCKDSIGWMFSKLDTNGDLYLDQAELAAINLDKYEVCIRPFFKSCDSYKDGKVSTAEWCLCFWRESEYPGEGGGDSEGGCSSLRPVSTRSLWCVHSLSAALRCCHLLCSDTSVFPFPVTPPPRSYKHPCCLLTARLSYSLRRLALSEKQPSRNWVCFLTLKLLHARGRSARVLLSHLNEVVSKHELNTFNVKL